MSVLPSHIQFTVGQQDYSLEDNLQLVTTDTVPGGYDTATFQLCDWRGKLPKLGDRVWVYDKTLHKTVWLGRLEAPETTTKSNEPQKFQARGYGFVGTTDRRFIPNSNDSEPYFRKWPAGAPIDVMIADALAQCNDVWSESIVTGGYQLLEDTQNFALQTPMDVFNFATGLTSGFGTPLLWWVRETTGSAAMAGLVVSFMDNSARYRGALAHDDKEYVSSQFSVQGIVNRGTVGWGKDQYYTELATSTPIPGIIRDKAVSATNNIRGQQEAHALAGNYVSRFNVFRALNETIVLCDAEITAQPPLFSVPTTVPHYLIRAGYGFYVTNMPLELSPYNLPLKFLIRTEYNWDTGVATLQAGELVNLESAIALIESFNANRLYDGVAHSAVSWPYPNGDSLPVFGPSYPGGLPVSFSNGSPVFVKDPNATGLAPFGAVVHPDLVWDEGIEANFVVGDIGTVGFKGAIRVIPGKFDECEVLLGDENGLITGAETGVKIKFHKLPAGPSTTMTYLFETPVITTPRLTGLLIQPPAVLGRREWVVPEVVQAATNATWAAMSLHAKKEQPGLKVNG